MDIVLIEQIWAIVLFLLLVFGLNTCSHLERKKQEFLKDPRNCPGKLKSDIIKPKTLRGILIISIGTGLCFGGMVLFMMHI
jgi:hypothetical protein